MFVLFDILLLLAGILFICWILGLAGISLFAPLGNLIWLLFVAALVGFGVVVSCLTASD